MTGAIEQSENEMDHAKRETQLQEILARFHELAPALLLVDYSSITGISPRVSNYQVRSNGVKFEEVMLSDH